MSFFVLVKSFNKDKMETILCYSNQIAMGVLGLSTELIKKVTLAYEPVWAIGTGVTANPDQIQEFINLSEILYIKVLMLNFKLNKFCMVV